MSPRFFSSSVPVILYNGFLAKSYTGKNVGDCNVFNEHLFLGAGFWCIITTVLGLISYAFWVWGAYSTQYNSQGQALDQEQGIAMGEPRTQQLAKE
ncbi:Innexin-14 [Bienertia sinuspersici]